MRWLLIAALALGGCTKAPTDGRQLVASCKYGDIYLINGRLFRSTSYVGPEVEPVASGVPIENVCLPPDN